MKQTISQTNRNEKLYYIEETAWRLHGGHSNRFHKGLRAQQQYYEKLKPLPLAPPIEISAFPNKRWSYNETTRVVLGTDSLGHFVKGQSKLLTFTFHLYPTIISFCIPLHWALDANNVSTGDQVRQRLWRSKGQVQSVRRGLSLESSSVVLSHRFKNYAFGMAKENFNKNSSSNAEESEKTLPLDDLVLPRWNGLDLEWEDGSFRNSSPWEITVAQFADLPDSPSRRSLLSSNNQRRTSFTFSLPWTMNEEVRHKIEEVLMKFVRTHDNIIYFLDDVTDAIAPGYSSVVPLTMCFRKVLKHLKKNDDDENDGCYYRSILSLTSDLRAIYRNCCLYNYQGSEITKQCQKAVTDALNSVKSAHMEILTQRTRLANESLLSIEAPKKIYLTRVGVVSNRS
jgi:hypothetical protein